MLNIYLPPGQPIECLSRGFIGDGSSQKVVPMSNRKKGLFLCKDVVVQGNPRVYKALRDQFAAVLDELRRIEASAGVDDELLDTINLIASIMDGMKEEDAYGN